MVNMKDVEVLPIYNHLGKVKNRVSKVGIELEGGWKWAEFPEGERYEIDRSVFRERTTKQRIMAKELMIQTLGELTSKPMLPAKIGVWMKKCYPHMVDETCGLHMHMSFDTKVYYSLLIRPEVQKTMIDSLSKWGQEEGLPASHPLWERLSGNNEYCNHEFYGDLQIQTGYKKDYNHFRPGNRYTAVAYRKGETIECRMLPMFETVDQSVRALKRVIDTTNACLVTIAERQKPEVLEMDDLPIGGVLERDVLGI